MRLHGSLPDDIVFNLKIDGRPFFGKDQVTVGVVPLDAKHRSSQSAKSVYPLAIANCKEKRKDLRNLFVNLNKRKEEIKRNGIWVDGKHVSCAIQSNSRLQGFAANTGKTGG